MENAVDALKIGAAVLVFVMAISITIATFAQIRQTSDVILKMSDKTNYYEYVGDTDNNRSVTRIVGVETIIPTLYRYANESLSIMILGKDGKIIQVFDLSIEGKLMEYKNSSDNDDDLNEKKEDIYNSYGLDKYGIYSYDVSPWSGSQENRKKRVEAFVNGGDRVEINNKYIDYGSGFMKNYQGESFEEMFKETLIEENANIDYDEELSGGASAISKITIVYQQQ